MPSLPYKDGRYSAISNFHYRKQPKCPTTGDCSSEFRAMEYQAAENTTEQQFCKTGLQTLRVPYALLMGVRSRG